MIWKTNSVTYHLYFFVGKFPKFFNFSSSMETIYLVELIAFKKMRFMAYRKFYLIIFLETFIFEVPSWWCVDAKNQDVSPSKISS